MRIIRRSGLLLHCRIVVKDSKIIGYFYLYIMLTRLKKFKKKKEIKSQKNGRFFINLVSS